MIKTLVRNHLIGTREGSYCSLKRLVIADSLSDPSFSVKSRRMLQLPFFPHSFLTTWKSHIGSDTSRTILTIDLNCQSGPYSFQTTSPEKPHSGCSTLFVDFQTYYFKWMHFHLFEKLLAFYHSELRRPFQI